MLNKFKLNTTNNVEITSTINRKLEIANSYAGTLSIEVLPLEKIEIDPENTRDLALTLEDAMNGIRKDDPLYERKKQDWKSLESLAHTIREDQLINPIYVYRYGTKCRLIAGERRTLASAIAGKKEIIARIADQRPLGTKLRVLQWIENNERSDLSLPEKIISLESILHEYSLEKKNKERVTAKLLSDLTGMSMTQARRYICILQADPEVKQAINEGKLENIKLIELICTTEDKQHQTELLTAAISGKTFETIVNLKKSLEVLPRINTKTVGRPKINVQLGKVKPNVAKIIFDSLINNNSINSNLVKKINAISVNIDWFSNESIQSMFKKLIPLLEKEVS